MKPSPVLVFPTIALAALCCIPVLDSLTSNPNYFGRVIEREAPSFTLWDAQGNPRSLSSFRGCFTYLFFGFTRCTGSCPRSFGACFSLANAIPDPNLRILFVSIDSQRDTQEQLANLQRGWDSRMIALQGDPARIRETAASFHEYFGNLPVNGDDSSQITHAGSLYLIDPQGVLRLIYAPEQLDIEKILADFSQLQKRGRDHASS